MHEMTAGVTREHESLQDMRWNILGQRYVPKLLSDNVFLWYAEFPAGTFVPPHFHPTQDEWICMLSGEFELWLDGETQTAKGGDTIRLPMGKPHGIFNKSAGTVECIFGVAPTRSLFELFQRIDNVGDPQEVVRLAAQHEVEFLPPPNP
jgi:quercetin dioxygenase-like cupin family protein